MNKRFTTVVLILASVSSVISRCCACTDPPIPRIANEYYQDVCIGCRVDFDGVGSSGDETGSYDPDNGAPYGGGSGIAKYRWNFGDDGDDPHWYGDEGDPNHLYEIPGMYTVALNVVDDDNTPSDGNDYCEVWVYQVSEVVERWTADPGPICVCLNGAVELQAIPYPNTWYFPGDRVIWEIVEQPADANASLSPSSGSATTTVSGFSKKGEYVVNSKCGTDDSGDNITVSVVNVEITSPIDPNSKFVFNSANPGVCNVPTTGTTGVSELDPNLQWWFVGIAGSTLNSSPDPPKGSSVTFTYTILPSSNSEFGEKTTL